MARGLIISKRINAPMNRLCRELKMKNMDIRKAIIFATQKHAGQVRKGTDIPYITHPMEVMQILSKEGCRNEVIIAGILHDVLEDTNTSPAEILDKFGETVLKIVAAESEDKSKTWKERKQATINSLAGASFEVKLVCCADKLSNLRSMAADLEEVGDKLWDRFNASKENIDWYYAGIIAALAELNDKCPMYYELRSLHLKIFPNTDFEKYIDAVLRRYD